MGERLGQVADASGGDIWGQMNGGATVADLLFDGLQMGGCWLPESQFGVASFLDGRTCQRLDERELSRVSEIVTHEGQLCGLCGSSLRLRQSPLFVFDSERYVMLPRPVWCAFVFVTELVIKVKVAV